MPRIPRDPYGKRQPDSKPSRPAEMPDDAATYARRIADEKHRREAVKRMKPVKFI